MGTLTRPFRPWPMC